ncbi:hypothetical protein AAG906_029744 [Vitis piasezkii]
MRAEDNSSPNFTSLGLANLESINLFFTAVTDSGLRKSSALSSLKSLNLDARQITDAGLAALTSLTGLTHLDLFGARITDSGTSYLRSMQRLILLFVMLQSCTSLRPNVRSPDLMC